MPVDSCQQALKRLQLSSVVCVLFEWGGTNSDVDPFVSFAVLVGISKWTGVLFALLICLER